MGRRGKGIFWLGEWIEGAELEPPAPPQYWGYDRTDTVVNKAMTGPEPLIRLWTTGGAVMVLTADDWRRAVADIQKQMAPQHFLEESK